MNNDHTSQKYAVLSGLLAVVCWSTVATAFKLGLRDMTPLQLILVASTVSSVFLLAILGFQKRLHLLLSQSRSVYLASFGFGLLNPTLYYVLLLWAYDLLPAQEAQAINYSWAIVMTFMAVPLLGQRLHWYDYLAAVICYSGVLIIATKGDVLSLRFENVLGVVLALVSTVVWSSYWIFNQKDRREPILGLTLNFLFALPLIVVACFITGDAQSLFASTNGLFAGVYIGLFEMGLAFILWLTAMKRAENTARVANLIFIAPFLSLVFISVFLGEVILLSTIVGLSFIIVGLITQQALAVKAISPKSLSKSP